MKKYLLLPILTAFLITGCGKATETTPSQETAPLTTSATVQTSQTSPLAITQTTKATTTQTTIVTTETTPEPVEVTNPPAPIPETEPPTESQEITPEPVFPEDFPIENFSPDIGDNTITEAIPLDDTTPPILTNDGSNAQVQIGTTFNLDNLIGYADDLDPHPVLTYSGFVDTNVLGSYPITATLTDSSGNAFSWNMTINVVGQITSASDNASPEYFSDFVASHAGDNCRYGIDVSKWQGDIDFNAVRNAGCSFVLMRIGSGADSISKDQYYDNNIQNATTAGLDVGVYFYSTASTQEEARFQADWIASELNGRPLQFPVVFDWESFNHFQNYGMSLKDLNNLYDAFADQLAQHGYASMLYSSKSKLETVWKTENRPIWLAHYVNNTNYGGNYSIWQQSNHGRIDGISEEVDFNILYTDRIYW